MSNELSYKGYKGSCAISIEDDCLHGRIQDIDDLITYEGNTVLELAAAFEDAVNRYLDHCAAIGKEPNKPYSGSFNVRVGSDLHKTASQHARMSGMSLNEFVRNALENAISKPQAATVHHQVTVNHVVSHEQKIEMQFSAEEPQWQPEVARPRLQVVR